MLLAHSPVNTTSQCPRSDMEALPTTQRTNLRQARSLEGIPILPEALLRREDVAAILQIFHGHLIRACRVVCWSSQAIKYRSGRALPQRHRKQSRHRLARRMTRTTRSDHPQTYALTM